MCYRNSLGAAELNHSMLCSCCHTSFP